MNGMKACLAIQEDYRKITHSYLAQCQYLLAMCIFI